MKKHSKQLHFSNLILKNKKNIKKNWGIIKKNYKLIKRKGYCNHQSFSKKLVIGNEKITHERLIARRFNIYFAQIGTNLAKTIETSSIKFESFLKKCDSIQPESPLSVNELKNTFFSLKINKSSGYDGISFNVVRNCFGRFLKPLSIYLIRLWKKESSQMT